MTQTNNDMRLNLAALIASPLFRHILDSLSSGIAILDRTGVYLYANKAYAEFHGFKNPARYIGQHVEKFFSSAAAGSMAALSSLKRNQELSVSIEGRKGISARIPILDDDGNLVCLITETLTTNISKSHLDKLLVMISMLAKDADYYKNEAQAGRHPLRTFSSIISDSECMNKLKQKATRYALTDKPILIYGESGTGKELMAQAIHMASPRAREAFVAVNCAALPESLISSELFGYTGGAFTGSLRGGQKGKFEIANKGTIFLDEIGELPLTMQATLLRVLESGEIQKIGSQGPVYSDFRLIAATNRNLLELVGKGEFREDLYHRISILQLNIPPLRERTEDIILIAESIINDIAGIEHGRNIRIAGNCLQALKAAEWKGNVREMHNILTAAIYNMDEDENIMRVSHLPAFFFKSRERAGQACKRGKGSKNSSLHEASSLAEREMIISTLKQCKGNRTQAAARLGISRTKLYNRLKRYGIE